MTGKVTPHPRNPMLRVVDLYKRLMVMAEAREFNQLESENLTALMVASNMIAAGPNVEAQTAAAKRIHRQAVEFVELGMLIPNQEGNETPAA